MYTAVILSVLFSLVLMSVPLAHGAAQAADPGEFFETRIRPVLANNCFACHTSSKLGDLQLDSWEHLLKGGKSGPAIVPGKPEESLLIRAVRHSNERLKMPLGGKLKEQEIADLTTWVKMGAPWPEGDKLPAVRSGEFRITEEQKAFWAIQPLQKPALPEIKNSSWAKAPIDHFVLSRLEGHGLKPVKAADKRTLIRRASFDLIGLPPGPSEIEAFLADASPDAFAKLVDRLLASPHYGERWGRYWLDVARYGETDIRSCNQPEEVYPNAWRYRDWVIGAFNEDVPYDVFVKAQVAGDLLGGKDAQKLIPGLGFFGLGPWHYDIAQPAQARADERNDRVDVLTRGFLGLTVACARCHDHKYDPISMQDYYALAGVFASTEYQEYALAPASLAELKKHQKKIKDQETALKQFLEEESKQLAEILARKTSRYLMAAWKVLGSPKLEISKAAAEDKLDFETLDRWVKYLSNPQNEYPYLKAWNKLLANGGTTEQVRKVADEFQAVLLSIMAEKKTVDEENSLILAQAKPKKKSSEVLLPNAFATYDDYCPVCNLTLNSIEREKFVLWTDLFVERQVGNGNEEKEGGVLLYREEKLESFLGDEWKEHLHSLRAELEALKKALPPYVHGIDETQNPVDLKLHLRGSPYSLREEVPRRFLAILSQGEPSPFLQGSGRLELAEAIAHHPLAARVIVNRIWQLHFGRGIVATPSNFGQLGERPSHRELLEYLASRFKENRYSIKALHREVMLSATYQLSSEFSELNFKADPGNRLLWRSDRRGLDAEALRDSLLFVSGGLDKSIGGPSIELTDENNRRTVYGKIGRSKLNGFLTLFDFPDPNITSEQRSATVVPLQGLFFTNSNLVSRQAELLANRLWNIASTDDVARIKLAYRMLYGREATESEVGLGLRFLQQAQSPSGGPPSAWQQYAQVLLSSNEFVFVN